MFKNTTVKIKTKTTSPAYTHPRFCRTNPDRLISQNPTTKTGDIRYNFHFSFPILNTTFNRQEVYIEREKKA